MSDFSWPAVINTLMGGGDLSREMAHDAMTEVMSGEATEAQIAAFIVSLRTKGETAEEMTGLVDAMFEAALTVDVGQPVVDVVGTGGDQAGTFNISTTAAFVVAGAGAKVAKHGNRAASSKTGSADLLEALGFDLELPPEATVQMIKETGFGFFFAPRYHPAMRFAAPVRRQLGVRTVFNFLGPLCNPAGATRMSVGTSDPHMAALMIEVLRNRGAESAFVFYGEDGLDELTTTGPSYIYRLRDGEITHAEWTPEDFGVARTGLDDLRGGDADENLAITRSILEGSAGPKRDIVLVNSTPAIVAAGLAEGFSDAMDLAKQAIDSGAATAVLENATYLSRTFANASS
ncbi:MAG: anthranilate phosphoribosyltransferase [Acidimicrobiia bacterium]|nr:anthranilate phosphoribosyltransferase [Acidimicrobiia bacterium]MBT8193114.1 anthranilate phosphoribosyltransferase [Acidimicrobiia bacterium]NNF87236.1 anthranilate phosphoribosyltransferase [Acidimicrobiia bacterium]NNL12508.1 anthranilate phosphoribosyltransferase [Acidimicrobiia bacterium]NNL97029.1 anthranilate phosphoribosyltransferase [Acidimicrobiia bacterium]